MMDFIVEVTVSHWKTLDVMDDLLQFGMDEKNVSKRNKVRTKNIKKLIKEHKEGEHAFVEKYHGCGWIKILTDNDKVMLYDLYLYKSARKNRVYCNLLREYTGTVV